MNDTVNKRVTHWAKDRPFLLATLVLLTIVLPGFLRIEYAVNTNRATADRNSTIVACLTQYATGMTDALQDRDAVNKTSRAAALEMWGEIDRWMAHPQTDITPMLEAIDQYRKVLGRLDRTAKLNPYPDIEHCLNASSEAVGFELMGAAQRHPGHPCFNRQYTILGTRGDDNIHGTDGSDVIKALKGDDLIIGGGGRDRICAGRGNDTINGGNNRDWGHGRRGSDICVQVEVTRSCS